MGNTLKIANTNTFLNKIEFSTVPFTILPLATRLFFTTAPGLYFAGGYTTRHMGYSPSYTTGDMAAKAAILAMEKEVK